MDTKYGRIFTQDDLTGLLAHLHVDFESPLAEVIAQAETEGVQFTFPTDEPQFVLRGQDQTAEEVVATWVERNDAWEYTTEDDPRSASHPALAAFQLFRSEHPDRLKIAD